MGPVLAGVTSRRSTGCVLEGVGVEGLRALGPKSEFRVFRVQV